MREPKEESVESALKSFRRFSSGFVPLTAIIDISANIERLREGELRRHRRWLSGLSDVQRANVEGLSRSIVTKILLQILSELRRSDGLERTHAVNVARRLLGSRTSGERVNADAPATGDQQTFSSSPERLRNPTYNPSGATRSVRSGPPHEANYSVINTSKSDIVLEPPGLCCQPKRGRMCRLD